MEGRQTHRGWTRVQPMECQFRCTTSGIPGIGTVMLSVPDNIKEHIGVCRCVKLDITEGHVFPHALLYLARPPRALYEPSSPGYFSAIWHAEKYDVGYKCSAVNPLHRQSVAPCARRIIEQTVTPDGTATTTSKSTATTTIGRRPC